MKSTVQLLTRKKVPQYMEVGRSVKLCFYSNHDNQHIDVLIHPFFGKKDWGTIRTIRYLNLVFFLKIYYLLLNLRQLCLIQRVYLMSWRWHGGILQVDMVLKVLLNWTLNWKGRFTKYLWMLPL